MSYEYWKQTLPAETQKAYEWAVNAISSGKMRASCGGITDGNQLQLLVEALQNDHPEFFWINSEVEAVSRSSLFSTATELIFTPIYNNRDIAKISAFLQKERERLVAMCSGKTDSQKEIIICDRILENVTYQIDNVLNQNAASALFVGRAQCSGISRAVKLMCEWVGMRCIVLGGEGLDSSTGSNGPHAWNLVEVDGTFYHLDVTFMLGANGGKRKPFRYLYLNYTDKKMAPNHTWIRDSVPPCTKEFSSECKPSESFSDKPFRPTEKSEPRRWETPKRESPKTEPKAEETKPTPKSGTVVATIPQLKQVILAAVKAGKRKLCFDVTFFMKDERLKKEVDSACLAVATHVGKKINFIVTVNGKSVSLSW